MGEKILEFSRLFQGHNYTAVIARKNFGDLAAFRVIFSCIFTVHVQKQLF